MEKPTWIKCGNGGKISIDMKTTRLLNVILPWRDSNDSHALCICFRCTNESHGTNTLQAMRLLRKFHTPEECDDSLALIKAERAAYELALIGVACEKVEYPTLSF